MGIGTGSGVLEALYMIMMYSPKKNNNSGKKNFLIKTWDRCRSISCSNKKKVTPVGFFPVYVGPEKQWFAVKTKYANHPLFRMLLDDAEIEYGYNTPGPILLPCDLDLFYKVVAEMDANEDMEPHGCGLVSGLLSPFSPGQRFVKGDGDYEILTPSRVVMTN
ncbi:uncharacterized protein [Rutidosis leptorrhynchoides]|uniref:uncharacterized protein n=1 Tax=Rutidosis leptorrhynchoides TaxID=125765 RepID=UPI003A9A5164